MKNKRIIIAGFIAALFILGSMPFAYGEDYGSYRSSLKAQLSGSQEVPAVSTTGSGMFTAKYDPENEEVNWKLSIHNLEGDIFQAHLHFGKRKTNGGIIAWLCGSVGTPVPIPPGTQTCLQPGTITGTIGPDDVIGPMGQGINPGEFGEFVEALFSNSVYVNTHSSLVPSGEIRGQVRHRVRGFHGFDPEDYEDYKD